MLPDVRKAFEQAINKKIPVARGDRNVLMTRIDIGLEQLLNQFAKGDRHARRDLMEYADKLGIDFLAPASASPRADARSQTRSDPRGISGASHRFCAM